MFGLFKEKRKLVTHSGSFHADDVFAAATLSLYLDAKEEKYEIIRTRDEKILEAGDYVFDVGQIYNHEQKRYDHHQRSGAGERPNRIPYAAFGLVWQHYGKALCPHIDVWQDIDETLVSYIDAYDNGIETYSSSEEYGIRPITIQNILHWLDSSEDKDEQFMTAVHLARVMLVNIIDETAETHEKIQELLVEFDSQKENQYVVFEGSFSRHLIWQALMPREDAADVLYAVYNNGKHTDWNIVAMRADADSFDSRKPLPEAWRGLETEKLREVSGVADAMFCHRSGFLAGAGSREGAVEMAEKAL